ncbi:MAG TPA: YciI family protein [Gammaproteobacteria bacterium]|nr:YciI family protein [Gammaproteobacteria bacterium]
MKYLVLFEDNDEFGHMREKHMDAHLQFMADHDAGFDAAGPLRDARTAQAAGGVWVIDAADTAGVQALVEADPFYSTGLRKSVRILEWAQTYADGRKLR